LPVAFRLQGVIENLYCLTEFCHLITATLYYFSSKRAVMVEHRLIYLTPLKNSAEFYCFVVDEHFEIRYSNDLFTRDFGSWPRKLTEFPANASEKGLINRFLQAAKACVQHPLHSHSFEFTIQLPGQPAQYFRWEALAESVQDNPGPQVRFTGSEISELRNTEEALNQKIQIIENISDAVVSSSLDFIIISWNKASEEIYGIPASEAIGKEVAFINYQYLDSTREEARETLQEKGYWKGEVMFRRKDGTDVYLQVAVSSMKSFTTGEKIGYVAVNRDITKQVEARQALTELRRQNHLFIDALHEGIVIQNNRGQIIECNKVAEKILGLSAAQMAGLDSLHPGWRAIHTDGSDFPGDTHPAMVTMKTGLPQNDVVMGVHKPTGEITWILINSRPVINEQGKMIAVATTFNDISEQKKASEGLASALQNKRAILGAANEGFCLVNERFQIYTINESGKKILKLLSGKDVSPGDLITDAIPSDSDLPVEAMLENCLQGELFELEKSYPTPEGVIWLDFTYKPVWEQDKIIAICITCRNVTKRKLAEIALQKSEQQFRSLSENIPGAVYEYVYRPDGTHGFRFMSQVIEKLFGINPVRFTEAPHHIHPDDLPDLLRRLEYSQKTNEPFYFKGRLISGDGKIKWHTASSSFSYFLEDGSRVYTGIIEDITLEKQLQQQIYDQQFERKREILKAVIEAQEKERQEISNELHENVNQVLSSCKLLLNIAIENPANSISLLKEIEENIENTINEIRDISQYLNSSTLELIGLPLAISGFAEKINHNRQFAITVNTREWDETIMINPDLQLTLFRIIQEQLMNIRRHSGASVVVIGLRSSQSMVEASVEDDGKGFDIGQVRKGLGLTNIFNRVEYYGGKTEIISSPGKGCALKISIPLYKIRS